MTQTGATIATVDGERELIRKIALRIVPLLALGQLASYLDRSNIAIASLTMMPALGLDASQFGLAAGLFFIGYFIGELPSNLLLVRFGARRWLARIMFTFGLISMCMAFVQGPAMLYCIRILLGLAEAGYAPGAVFYIAFWFPARYRSRIFGMFLLAIPISAIIGAPISAALLKLDGLAGMQGWQWLFIMEGLPALLAAFLCLKYLPDSPAKAKWLDDDERRRLGEMLAKDLPVQQAHGNPVTAALRNVKMWQIALFSFGVASGSYGTLFFLPQIISAFGTTNLETGLLNTIPFIAALIAMPLWARRSDRKGERRLHAACPLLAACIAFALSGLATDPVIRMITLTIGTMGIFMAMGLLWSFVPQYFAAGVESAAAIALVNMISTLSGVIQPVAMGKLRVMTGDYNSGLLLTAALMLAGVISVLMLKSEADPSHERS